MAPGKHAKSPVLTALKKASNITRAPIHVHISQSSLQKISKKHAERVFTYFGLDKAPEQNSILIFLNLKNRKFTIVYGDEIDAALKKSGNGNYWELFRKSFQEDLQSTQFENALAIAILTIAITLEKLFPIVTVQDF
ncbi:MAG: hypothetical protein A3K03_06400 [Bdellovibrionales bacterium RIFOXYD1_FULL_44_7]|nr:MAG: hypothetical protein A3K03_06400 [Bdellovibrionales bacterium RIFOXYD1_FULL_44_7]